ncbi:MAG: seg [Candidatus Taylorbacteria bacterium]|nr:seg [Candidatus Taylorbacteria bacterium]
MDNINPIEYNPQDHSRWNKFGFFLGDSYLPYVFKKIEKISAALYMVSELLKDSEPLKWELREQGILMLSTALSMNGVEPIDKSALVQTFFTAALEATTFLNAALMGGLVSRMNHAILVREIDLIVTLVKERVAEDTSRAGYVLSDTFFKTEELPFRSDSYGQPSKFELQKNPGISDKKAHDTEAAKQSSALKDKKSERQNLIISLLKKDSDLTIKDFAEVVQDCSEKTIQRELLELVDKGVVKKVGERRWSRYSLQVDDK